MRVPISFLVVLFLLIEGCKALDSGDTYTIRGRVMQDCNTPISGYNVKLNYYVKSFLTKGKNDDLAFDTTDAQGYFTLRNIPVKYKNNLRIINVGGDGDIHTQVNIQPPIENGYVHDLGTFYKKATMHHLAKLTIDLSNIPTTDDTLFLGYAGGHLFKHITPIPASDTLAFSNNGSDWWIKELDEKYAQVFWATRRSYFDSVTSNLVSKIPVDKDKHVLPIKAFLCNNPDTTFLNIP